MLGFFFALLTRYIQHQNSRDQKSAFARKDENSLNKYKIQPVKSRST